MIGVLLGTFLCNMFLANISYSQAKLYQITFTKYFIFLTLSSYNQYVFGVSAVVLLLSYTFFKIWLRTFYLHDYRFSIESTAAMIIFWFFSIAFGVIGYFIFQTNPFALITISIFLCPALISAISFFSILLSYLLVHWRNNDFSFYYLSAKAYIMSKFNPELLHLDLQQISSLFIFYLCMISFGMITSYFFAPTTVGYTTATWIVIIWCGGLGIWEYIGCKHEWSPFCLINIILSLAGIIIWSCVYLLVSIEDPDDFKYYVLFAIFGLLAIGSLIFALICFVDSQYALRPIIYFLFVLAFASGITASIFLWIKWLSIIFIASLTILAYFIYLYITYKRNKYLNSFYQASVYIILGAIGFTSIITSALYSNTAMFLVSFGILLGSIACILLYLYFQKVINGLNL